MPVDDWKIESLERRIDRLETKELEELQAKRKRDERIIWLMMAAIWFVAAVVWTSLITAEIVGD